MDTDTEQFINAILAQQENSGAISVEARDEIVEAIKPLAEDCLDYAAESKLNREMIRDNGEQIYTLIRAYITTEPMMLVAIRKSLVEKLGLEKPSKLDASTKQIFGTCIGLALQPDPEDREIGAAHLTFNDTKDGAGKRVPGLRSWYRDRFATDEEKARKAVSERIKRDRSAGNSIPEAECWHWVRILETILAIDQAREKQKAERAAA